MGDSQRREVSTKQLADHVSLTPQRITQYHAEGMPQIGRNKWDLDACCKWIRDYERQLFEQRLLEAGSAQDEYYRAQASKIAVEEQRSRDKLARERGELIHIGDLVPELNRTYGKVKQRLIGLEARLKSMIGPDHAKAVGKELRRILTELADDSERIAKARTKKPKPST